MRQRRLFIPPLNCKHFGGTEVADTMTVIDFGLVLSRLCLQ